ncbi:hypothetical protein T10_13705 [Trichinella papuae]|uniref:Uncharacterized protein n=1 Tax=Trichinella papuae TaxID=268474 RepID=A0A0V1M6V5_9BILA|nr:hypothetical protein T10_13705 [Trichinella papuae]
MRLTKTKKSSKKVFDFQKGNFREKNESEKKVQESCERVNFKNDTTKHRLKICQQMLWTVTFEYCISLQRLLISYQIRSDQIRSVYSKLYGIFNTALLLLYYCLLSLVIFMESSIFFYMGITILFGWILVVLILLRRYWFVWQCPSCCCYRWSSLCCRRRCTEPSSKKIICEEQCLTEI